MQGWAKGCDIGGPSAPSPTSNDTERENGVRKEQIKCLTGASPLAAWTEVLSQVWTVEGSATRESSPCARPWALAGERHYLLGSATGCPTGMGERGGPHQSLLGPQCPAASWAGGNTSRLAGDRHEGRGEKMGVLVGQVPPLARLLSPGSSASPGQPTGMVCTARPHLKLPLPASRAAEHLLPCRWPLAAFWVLPRAWTMMLPHTPRFLNPAAQATVIAHHACL